MNVSQTLLTVSGKYVNVVHPDPSTLCIVDIAHALSQINRFGGHTSTLYNVAQHSVLVSQILPEEYKLAGLLHDASEAYFGDLVRPIKYLDGMTDYRDQESIMQAAINSKFGAANVAMTDKCRDAIRHADLVLLATERRDFMHPDTEPWPILFGIEPMKTRIRPLAPITAKAEFLTAFKRLTGVF